MSRHAHSRGMTLIEVMISVAVLTMIIASVWSGFRGTIDGMQAAEKVQDRYSMVRNGLSRMASEIGMTYTSFNRPMGEQRHFTLLDGRNEGDSDNLTFSSFSHLRVRKDANESDQSVIQYFLEVDPDDSARTHLYRRETRRLSGDNPEDMEDYAAAYVLIEDVQTLEFEYWDDRQQEWIDEWRTNKVDMQPDRLPHRIKIKLTVLDRVADESLEFHTQVPLLIQERINLGQTQ